MKKSLLFVFLMGALCNYGYTQYERPRMPIHNLDDYELLDSAYLKVTYRLLSVKDPAKPEETYEDIQVLQVGSTVSKFYSQYLLQYSETVAEELQRKPNSQAMASNPYSGSYGYEVFRNYLERQITVTNHDPNLLATYRYEEPSPTIQWTLTEGTTTVLSYTCRRATTTFRGRSYTAWFTTEIPISSGPWKFGGLPGLILKLEDSERHYVWESIGLEQLSPKEPIRFYNHPLNPGTPNLYTPISREDLNKLYRRFHNDMAAFVTAGGVMVRTMRGGRATQISTSPEMPYNPIELE
jgi:GLPGLI family protein